MAPKYKSYEFIAIDLVYINRDAVTLKLVHASIPDLGTWVQEQIKSVVGQPNFIGVHTYSITLQ